MSDFDYNSEVSFTSAAPGYWSSADVSLEEWSNYRWQMKNRVESLEEVEKHLQLSEEERAGILLTGTKLASAVTPHFFNLVEADNPDCPIRRQIVPQVAETFEDATEMADPCGEDSHMPVPGLVHRYPDRVLLLVIDRCASYCRYCTRSRSPRPPPFCTRITSRALATSTTSPMPPPFFLLLQTEGRMCEGGMVVEC